MPDQLPPNQPFKKTMTGGNMTRTWALEKPLNLARHLLMLT